MVQPRAVGLLAPVVVRLQDVRGFVAALLLWWSQCLRSVSSFECAFPTEHVNIVTIEYFQYLHIVNYPPGTLHSAIYVGLARS